jgi:hypothetical protein
MIVFEIPPPFFIGAILYNIMSFGVFFLIVYGLYKIKFDVVKRYGQIKAYLFFGVVFFISLIWLPVREVVSTYKMYSVWNQYKNHEYEEYIGKFKSLKYGTTGVRVFLSNNEDFYMSSWREYCFSFSLDDGFDENKEIYIRYIPFGDSSEPANCVVYAEHYDNATSKAPKG